MINPSFPHSLPQQKEKKKRKIKAIKSKARLEVREQEQSATQDNWKAFQSKVLSPSLKPGPIPLPLGREEEERKANHGPHDQETQFVRVPRCGGWAGWGDWQWSGNDRI
jgi:hypothetical protein